jgi:hypothetical protein
MGVTIGECARWAHRYLENLDKLSLARLTLPRFPISPGKCELHGHILWRHMQPYSR